MLCSLSSWERLQEMSLIQKVFFRAWRKAQNQYYPLFKQLSAKDKKYSIKLWGIVILPHRLHSIE